VLQRILLLEQNIRRWISEAEFCRRHRRAVRVGSRTVAGFCEPLDTALNYFFPSVVRPGTVAGVSPTLGGKRGPGPTAASAPAEIRESASTGSASRDARRLLCISGMPTASTEPPIANAAAAWSQVKPDMRGA
jgi:hypothetical protein